MKTTHSKPSALLCVAFVFGVWSSLAQAATPYANATIEGALSPGVYGRIEIGTAPPPPLV